MVFTLFLYSYLRALIVLLLEFKNKLKELKEVNFLTIVIPFSKFRKSLRIELYRVYRGLVIRLYTQGL